MSSDTSLADEGGDAAREDTELPTCLRQVEEAATAYLENPALSDADRRNILSTLPGNDITMDVFYAGAEGDILDPTHEAIIPRSLIWSYVMDGSNDALESIAAYFEPALDEEAKRAFIISPFDQKVDFIVVSEVHKTRCVLRFFGLRERLDPVPSWVMQILDTVGHLLRQRLPDFNYEVVRQCILPPNDISLVLLAIIRYGIYSRPYIFPSTADWNTLMDLNNIRAHCFWEYAGPEFRRRHHGQDVTKRNVLGHTGNFDMEAYEDSNHEHADEGHPNDGHAGEQLEVEKLFQLDEDSESDTSSDAGEDYANDRVNTTTVFRNFDPEPYLHAMHKIDLDKTARIKEYVERELTHDEIDEMKFDAGDENALDKLLPKNLESEKLVRENNDMKKGVEKCRERVSAVLDNLVKFMIAVGSRKNLPEDMRGWYALLLANATKEGRERIIRMLTHSSVQPLSLQYLLGQDTWAPTMFDSLAKIDLENPGEHGDLVSAYVGVGHGSDDQHFSYCGSATNTRPTSRYIGEEDRMRTHRRILALGSKEIRRRRRQAGAGGTEILLAHDKLAYSAEKGGSFFFATHRFPVHPEHSSFKKFAALALLAELINVIHLGSVSTWYTPRKSSNKAFMLISRLLMKGLRPKDLPEPVFIGTNVVLPMTQVPRAIWQLLDRSNHLRPTEKLLEDLQKVFDDRRSLSLDWADCEAVLAQNGQLSTRTNINALRKVYGDILLGKGLEYQTRFQAKHLKLTVLFTAFIRVAELQQLTYEMDGTSFGVEATKIDWISVSQEAQYIAPEGLRDIYTPEACRKLYESSKTADFREKVALFVNWERLIEGVPAKFVSAREQAQYPLPIKLRIRDICRFAVYWDMETQSYFEEKDPGSEDSRAIRLRPRTSPTVTHLVPEVIEQLKVDIGLSDGVDVKEGAWEDQTLRVSLITQLRRAFDQLRSGVSQEEVDQWKQLEELEMGWANPPVDESDLEIVLEKLHDLSTRHNILSPIRSQEILTNVDLLRKCHINPIPITRGEQRKDAGSLARTEAQMNAKPKTEKPFGLLDQDGQPVRRTLFTTSCFKKTAASERDVEASQRSRVGDV